MAAADPWSLKALGGGFACMVAATVDPRRAANLIPSQVTNPIDVLKTRLQLQGTPNLVD